MPRLQQQEHPGVSGSATPDICYNGSSTTICGLPTAQCMYPRTCLGMDLRSAPGPVATTSRVRTATRNARG